MTTVRIGSRIVGPGSPCVIVAEVGINHNGDIGLAKRTIDAAAGAGADAVKFQNYRVEDFIADRSLTYSYAARGATVVESQYEMFKRYELSRETLRDLCDHSAQRGIMIHSTPTSEEGVRELVDLGIPVLKNGSDFLTHLPLIRAMGRTGLPAVISTGMATLAEIDEAVRAFRDTGNEQLILLHCTSAYPAPPESAHLRKIPALAEVFGCPVGLSDHTVGTACAVGAVALGACWLEKHFTLDRSLPGPDHRFSADPEELQALVAGVRAVEAGLGDARVVPTPVEEQGRREFRLSCVAARDLPAGHRLEEADVVLRRPGVGFPPGAAPLLVGRRLARGVPAGKPFEPGDFAG